MDYAIQILTALLDRYERRTGKSSRAVTIEIIKCCPAYRDHLSAEERNIDQAVTCLVDWQMIDAPRSPQGYYTKLTLHLDHLSEIYARLNRTPLADLRQAQRDGKRVAVPKVTGPVCPDPAHPAGPGSGAGL